jgi:hypothetical protein
LWTNQKKSVSGKPLADTTPAIPCGLVAKSFFNDTFVLNRIGANGEKIPVEIDETGIAWSSDIEYKFNNIEVKDGEEVNWKDFQWVDMKNGKFNFLI